MAITALAPWYGSNRMLAKHVGAALRGCEWVGVPFAGGMSEVREIKARTLLVSDLHRQVIHLAYVVGHDKLKPHLVEQLEQTPVHPDSLSYAQAICRQVDTGQNCDVDSVGRAAAYFICAWMARNATAGTDREFDAKIATRWNASGGDSAVRFRNATKSLDEWLEIMRRCNFVCLDVFAFLLKVKDLLKHGIYLDPPFFQTGEKYKYNIGKSEAEQIAWYTKLRDALLVFKQCRIVLRSYDTPLIRELYPADLWDWTELEGRKQTNASAPEVLICRN